MIQLVPGPLRADGLCCLSGPQRPVGVSSVPALCVLRFDREDVAVRELVADHAVQHGLVPFDRHQHVCPLGEAPLKKDFVVWSASVWISTPSRSIPLSSS